MIKLNKKSIVYVLCPAKTKTGGPELLHQLVYKLNKNNIGAYITYFEYDNTGNHTPSDFKKYVDDFKLIEDIEDDYNNIIIFPETSLELVRKFKNIRKAMWWLSVDNYINKYEIKDAKRIFGIKQTLINIFKLRINYRKDIYNYDYHLCQSNYAIDYLKNKKLNNNVYYLSDYINSTFFEKSNKKRKKQVLYNPKKGFEFTKKLIDSSTNIKWIPIQGLTTEGVHQLLQESMIYIDFGNHPGKDRFPREAAMSGCIIITGKNGSAANIKDVPIKKEYKFDRNNDSIDMILKLINNCLKNYDKKILDFREYQEFIIGEEKKFEEDIKNIFEKCGD